MPKPKFKQRDINGNIYYSYDIEGKLRVPNSSIEVGTVLSNPSVRRQQQRITVEGSNKVIREKAAAQKAANTIVVGGRPHELDTPKQATIGPIDRDLEVFNLSPKQLDAMIERDRLEKAQQEAGIAAGNFVNMLMPSTIARAAYDATTGDKSFLGSMVEGNKGLGNGAANLVFDMVAPVAWAKGVKYVGRGLNKGMRFMNSPLTGNWTRLGSKEYRLSPGTLGMNGTSIERRPIDVSKWTPEQWTDAQDAAVAKALNITPEEAASLTKEQFKTAVARGVDLSEAQRLKDLHFKIKSGNDNEVFAHSTHAKFTEFDKSHFGETDEGFNGKGFYFATTRIPDNQSLVTIQKGPHGEIPTMNYGPNKMYVYLKGDREFTELTNPSSTRDFFKEPNTVGITDKYLYENGRPTEIIVGNPNQIKSADAITFDNNGIRIPLGKRDNFNINDFRWALAPVITIGGLATAFANSRNKTNLK